MRGALGGRAAVAAPAVARPTLAPPLLALATVLLAGLAVLAGGGSRVERIEWIGVGAALVLGAAVAAVALGLLPRPRLGRPGVALALAASGMVVWAGLSLAWSIDEARTWESFNRAAAYGAFLGLGLVAGGLRRRPAREAALLLLALGGAAVVWALAGKVAPGLGPDQERSARLREPVGYWNALALLVAMTLPAALWAAAERAHGALVRAGAAALLFLGLVALALTASRGGILVGLVALGAWLLLARARLEGAVALALAVPPAVAVAAWALATPGIADAGALERGGDGAVLGAALAAGLALVGGLAWWLARRPEPEPPRRRALGRLVAGTAAVGAVAAVVAVVAAFDLGGAWDEFRNPPTVEVSNDPGRLRDPSSNHRWSWWADAWAIFRDHPVAGAGAGAYELARRPIRDDTRAPVDPHDIALAALAETGAVGFLLLAALVGAAGWVAASALRRLVPPERAAAAALTAAAAAYLVHALVDMPWRYAAVSVPLFLLLGVLATAGRVAGPRGGRAPLAALAAAGLALAAAFSLASPALAERRLDAATEALAAGDLAAAERAARRASELNPLAVEPLLLRAALAEFRGDLAGAERLYERAVAKRPEDSEAWFELGRFRFEAQGDLEGALAALDRSFGLDGWSPETGRYLNLVRAAMERRDAAGS